jgi:hypothetical protein
MNLHFDQLCRLFNKQVYLPSNPVFRGLSRPHAVSTRSFVAEAQVRFQIW